MKTCRWKIESKTGFSLAETLVALIIILLVSSIIAAGMPAAQRALVNVRESANAQMFLSTTLNELRNELATASSINANGNEITYVNPVTGNSKIEFDAAADGGKFVITSYMDLNADGSLSGGYTRPLVSNAARTEKLSINFETGVVPFPNSSSNSAYTEGASFITVSGFGVKSSLAGDAVLADVDEYIINVIVK